tara:strand:- start:325 stop:597 length:273 start_codon:yes stop_codon:yes gene_type:complete
MSEENTQPVETAESTDEQVSAPQLGVNDLKLMANILEVVSNRGAIKANEMAAVGTLYNNLMTFLIANGAVEMPVPEVQAEQAPEEGEAND